MLEIKRKMADYERVQYMKMRRASPHFTLLINVKQMQATIYENLTEVEPLVRYTDLWILYYCC